MGSIEEHPPNKCPVRLANVGGGGQKNRMFEGSTMRLFFMVILTPLDR